MKTPSFGSTGVSSILSTGGCEVASLLSAIVGLRTLLSQTCTEVVDNTVISNQPIHTGDVMKHSKQVVIEKIATSARTLVKLTTCRAAREPNLTCERKCVNDAKHYND